MADTATAVPAAEPGPLRADSARSTVDAARSSRSASSDGSVVVVVVSGAVGPGAAVVGGVVVEVGGAAVAVVVVVMLSAPTGVVTGDRGAIVVAEAIDGPGSAGAVGAGALGGAVAAGAGPRSHSVDGRRCGPANRPNVPLRGAAASPPRENDQPSTVPRRGVRAVAPRSE
jgi:hypothetical protein